MAHPNSRLSTAERFEQKVDRSGDCHRWIGAHSADGYGRFYCRGVNRLAHRVALELARVEIPDGMTIDHVRARGCRHRDCVRVDHLEVVTPRENTLRGDGPSAVNARKIRCDFGHEFMPTLNRGRQWRVCPTCRADWRADWLADRRGDG